MVSARNASMVLALSLVGCGGAVDTSTDPIGSSSADLSSPARKGERLFEHKDFNGNGRTCGTCHNEEDGALSPAEAQARYRRHGHDPLFRSIDSDDGVGDSYTRLLKEATIRVTLPLPAFISLTAEPTANTVTYNRGVPSVFNTPALDPVLMADGRAPDLAAQAQDAIASHFGNASDVRPEDLQNIAAYEKTLFSSRALARYAQGEAAPTLPAGNTASEKRGRKFFLADGLCGQCHGGPMLNTMTSASMFGPEGTRFSNVLVSEFNEGNQPVRDYTVTFPDGSGFSFPYTDLGRVVVSWDPNDLGSFKIPTLWGVKRTAPYFHDNSAPTLAAMVEHYAVVFESQGQATFTAQDKSDIVNYLRLL